MRLTLLPLLFDLREYGAELLTFLFFFFFFFFFVFFFFFFYFLIWGTVINFRLFFFFLFDIMSIDVGAVHDFIFQ